LHLSWKAEAISLRVLHTPPVARNEMAQVVEAKSVISLRRR
jgi:hypothetical protein